MPITYKGFRIKCAENEKKLKQVKKDTGLSNDTISKLNNDGYVSVRTLEIVANYFNCDIGDLVSIQRK